MRDEEEVRKPSTNFFFGYSGQKKWEASSLMCFARRSWISSTIPDRVSGWVVFGHRKSLAFRGCLTRFNVYFGTLCNHWPVRRYLAFFLTGQKMCTHPFLICFCCLCQPQFLAEHKKKHGCQRMSFCLFTTIFILMSKYQVFWGLDFLFL